MGPTRATIESLQNNFGIVDYGVFCLFLLSSALIGVFFGWKGRHNKNNKDFLTGNRNLPMFPVVLSLAASFMSSSTILGVPAEVYTLGTQYWIGMVCFTIAVTLSAEVFMPVFYRLNMTSINEYLFLRFKSRNVRLCGAFAFITGTLPYMGIVLFGPSLALASVTPLSVNYSVLVVGVICTFYTSIGGIKAVIWTDVLQCILMMLGVFMIVAYSFFDVGGWTQPFITGKEYGRIKIFETDTNIYRSDTALAVLSGTLINWCASYCMSQTETQRFCSTKSEAHAKKTLYWNIPPVVFIGWVAIWSGLVVFNRYYQCDPISMGIVERHDQLIPYFVMDTMSSFPGIAGLFTACVFSGSLSTLSSGFNSLAAVTWDDFLRPHISQSPLGQGVATANITKLIAAGYGVVSLALAFFVGRLGTVFQATIALSGSARGPLFAIFCLGLFVPFTNSRGAIAGIASGFVISLGIAIGPIFRPRPTAQLHVFTNNCSQQIYEAYGHRDPQQHTLPRDYEPRGIDQILHISYFYVMVVGFCVALIVGIAVSLFTRNPDEEAVDRKLLAKHHFPEFRKQSSRYDVSMQTMK